jgi:hypothetical protein
MNKRPPAAWLLIFLFIYSSCHSPSAGKTPSGDSTAQKPAPVEAVHNPEFRQQVKKEAVADYKEDIAGDRLNRWDFSVHLYETNRTLDYRVKMQYEELKGEDTIHLPDLGTPPRLVIKKGGDKYSCIIGFMDNDNAFREYKLVYFSRQQELGIHTLKHYSVTQGYKLVSQ